MLKPTQYETIVPVPDDYNQIFDKCFLTTEDRRSPLSLMEYHILKLEYVSSRRLKTFQCLENLPVECDRQNCCSATRMVSR